MLTSVPTGQAEDSIPAELRPPATRATARGILKTFEQMCARHSQQEGR
jgi:hypothetical protein